MPQKDRYRDRMLELDFEANESFENLPQDGRFSLVLITSGSARTVLNDKVMLIMAPCVLCLSDGDKLSIQRGERIAAQTLSFAFDFFCSAENEANAAVPTGLSVFERSESNTGVFTLEKGTFTKLQEWLFILATEIYAQSDPLWVCRIKKYLLQIIGVLENLYIENERDPVELVRKYICSNYFKKITLDELCRRALINRVSLNKLFRERYGCTAMQFLNDYRLKMAEKILTYTRMSLNDVAHAVGFEYDTYFIRQFTRWKGMSPTKFRNISQRKVLGDTELSL